MSIEENIKRAMSDGAVNCYHQYHKLEVKLEDMGDLDWDDYLFVKKDGKAGKEDKAVKVEDWDNYVFLTGQAKGWSDTLKKANELFLEYRNFRSDKGGWGHYHQPNDGGVLPDEGEVVE